MPNAIISIYYPQQLLPAIAALESDGGKNAEAIMFVWTPPATNTDVFKRRLDMFEILLRPFPNIKLWMPSPTEITANLSQSHRVMTKAKWLKQHFSQNKFDKIYFSSDVTGDFTPQALFQAFPDAERISYGDAMGLGYTLKSFEKELFRNNNLKQAISNPSEYMRGKLVWLKRRITLPLPRQRLEATTACMVLPCDQYGDFLPNKKIVDVPYSTAQQILEKLALAISESGRLEPIMRQIAGEDNPSLLLLGSFSESRLCSVEEEISLYIDVVNEHVEAGSLIILKPHPAARPEKLNLLTGNLNGKYRTLLMEGDINDIPIELLPELVKRAKVLSFSYSSVSLSYLYGTSVLHVMTDSLISKHISLASRNWMKAGNDLYLSLMDKYQRNKS